MMNIKIGKKNVIQATSILIPAHEGAWLEFPADTWQVRINILFEDSKEDSSQGFNLQGKDDHAVLTLKNWNNALPMGIEEPFQLGVVNGRNVEFLFSGYSVGKLKKLELVFMWGDKDGN